MVLQNVVQLKFQPPVVNTNDITFNEFYDISSKVFKNMMDICARLKTITPIEVRNIERSTKGQSSSHAWHHHRKYKITASNFYNAARNKVEPSNSYLLCFISHSPHPALNMVLPMNVMF